MPDFIEELKREVEKSFGKKIAVASDCEALSQKLQEVTEVHISAQTIRRFWKLIDSPNKPSKNTINTLSQYIGYRDYTEFVSILQSKPNASHISFDFEVIKQMFKENTHYLNQYEIWHETMTILLAEQIMKNRNFFESFVEHLGHNKGAMDYIIAGFHYYDLVNTDWYMRGFRTFCNNSKSLHHKLYLASIEYFALILNQRQQEGKIFIEKMKNLLPKVRKEDGFIFPLEGAVYGCRIADAYFNGNLRLKQSLIEEAIKICKENSKEKFIVNKTMTNDSFVHNIIEILILVGLYEDAFEFIATFDYRVNANNFLRKVQVVIIEIHRSILYFQNGEIALAQKVFNAIDYDEKYIRFDKKSIVHFHYLLISLGLSSKKALVKPKKIKTEIEKLANKTGMYIFKSKIAEFE